MYILPYSLERSLTEPEAHWLGWQARELLGSARLQPAVLRLQACGSRTGLSTWVLGIVSESLMLANTLPTKPYPQLQNSIPVYVCTTQQQKN